MSSVNMPKMPAGTSSEEMISFTSEEEIKLASMEQAILEQSANGGFTNYNGLHTFVLDQLNLVFPEYGEEKINGFYSDMSWDHGIWCLRGKCGIANITRQPGPENLNIESFDREAFRKGMDQFIHEKKSAG